MTNAALLILLVGPWALGGVVLPGSAIQMGRGLVWPQRLQVTVGFPDGVRQFRVPAGGAVTEVAEAKGMPRPLYVIPNGGGLGYGLFKLDADTLRYLLLHLETARSVRRAGNPWFNAFRDVALTPEGLRWLERVWRREEKIAGLTFAETDEIDMR